LLLGLVVLAGCGARSAIDCFGETCQAAGAGGTSSDGVGSAGTGGRFDPTVPVDLEPPGDRPPTPIPPRDDPDEPDTTPDVEPPRSFTLCELSDTYRGSVTITRAAELATIAGCRGIIGDLLIANFTAENLEPLRSLETVRGALTITGFSGSLEGLNNLESVDSLGLEGIDTPTLSPLRRLSDIGGARAGVASHVGELYISAAPNLQNLDGLGGIETVGSIALQHNSALESLAGLQVPPTFVRLTLTDNPILRDVADLGITALDTLEIEQTGLSSLAGFGSLQEVDTLALINNVFLTSIGELVALQRVRVWYIEQLPLTTLPVFPALNTATQVLVQNNQSLVDVDSLASIGLISQLDVIGNPSLLRLPSFPNLTTLQEVHIRDNQSLGSGPDFPNATRAEFISIIENPALPALRGFRTLESVRAVDISKNPLLTEVDFSALLSARTVRINCNVALPDTSLDPLRDVDGQLNFTGNLGSSQPCVE
jgi:hypothetical protein